MAKTNADTQRGSGLVSHRSRSGGARQVQRSTGRMKSPEVIPQEAKDQFWAVVKECLRVFHNRRGQVALRQVGNLRNKRRICPVKKLSCFFIQSLSMSPVA